MDLKPFKLDIDELINDFAEKNQSSFTEWKKVWLSRKFSLLFEAKPPTKHAFFMQSLYGHCIGYMISTDSMQHRLGGLYCLYCLHEIQPFKPPFKAYLSVGELTSLRHLVVDARNMNIRVVSTLVKAMLEKNIFLLGAVDLREAAVKERVDELTDIQNARIQSAYNKLFSEPSGQAKLEDYVHMDLGKEINVDAIMKISKDYAVAKELAITEASKIVDVQDIKHIAKGDKLIGEVVRKCAEDWNTQKQLFYQRTGMDQKVSIEKSNEADEEHEEGNANNFTDELEQMLYNTED
ncbi:uncharacterized protein LOC124935871 [Impatiens glandulifera]|uniref:uncharacterized protein LOC124935871 n=1 Tax=Impatiens glandulifera TaxID=253017 RepID=UPI001FB16CD7|nr:uncharacterized protein LOC124935871 [Impatiens glandulifera]